MEPRVPCVDHTSLERKALRLRGHLTCTNKRAQAAEQKIARNESFFSAARHAPTLHVFNVGPK